MFQCSIYIPILSWFSVHFIHVEDSIWDICETVWPSGLRRVTWNHFSSGGVGSNPATVVFNPRGKECIWIIFLNWKKKIKRRKSHFYILIYILYACFYIPLDSVNFNAQCDSHRYLIKKWTHRESNSGHKNQNLICCHYTMDPYTIREEERK